jgi:hypothetical protein
MNKYANFKKHVSSVALEREGDAYHVSQGKVLKDFVHPDKVKCPAVLT